MRGDTHDHIIKDECPLRAAQRHLNDLVIAQAEPVRLRRAHVHVPLRQHHAVIQADAASWPHQFYAWCMRQLAREPYRGVQSERQLIGAGDLDLILLARRPNHAHMRQAPLGPHERHGFLRRELTRLMQRRVDVQRMTRPEQCDETACGQMHVACGDRHGNVQGGNGISWAHARKLLVDTMP